MYAAVSCELHAEGSLERGWAKTPAISLSHDCLGHSESNARNLARRNAEQLNARDAVWEEVRGQLISPLLSGIRHVGSVPRLCHLRKSYSVPMPFTESAHTSFMSTRARREHNFRYPTIRPRKAVAAPGPMLHAYPSATASRSTGKELTGWAFAGHDANRLFEHFAQRWRATLAIHRSMAEVLK